MIHQAAARGWRWLSLALSLEYRLAACPVHEGIFSRSGNGMVYGAWAFTQTVQYCAFEEDQIVAAVLSWFAASIRLTTCTYGGNGLRCRPPRTIRLWRGTVNSSSPTNCPSSVHKASRSFQPHQSAHVGTSLSGLWTKCEATVSPPMLQRHGPHAINATLNLVWSVHALPTTADPCQPRKQASIWLRNGRGGEQGQ